ncbi:PhaM family polyhydroxyalkanoate granule multifunctional regulatory protein [Massilia sp. LXY-6]|uniref:PhaM family polyhydroxyalkanoate granule multifunctional regulatory protein n=1 Tax=Massilia sp. LXY-6 TaxID=3379823 RepID=UPI003EE1802B
MLKPPATNIPGMTDTLDFVKNLWGSMNLPGTNMSGMSAPPLSAEDLDKRIADLKAVESWLNMNVTMLRGTIQTMEVQRATLATLKSMGASMAEAMRQSGVSTEKIAGMPFGPFFGQPAAGAAAGGGGGTAQPGAAPGQDPAAGAAAAAMPAALAWWNMLQQQFTQAVATAMAPADGAAKTEPQGDAQAPHTAPEPGAAPNGNGRARGGKPKADKA